jgi:predicted Zn-dependent protease
MGGWFYRLGQAVGPKVRQANWVVQSLTGTEMDAVRAEQSVGRDLAQALLATSPAEGHPEVEAWLAEIGARLVAGIRPRVWHFRFHILGSREVNAFALPGGYLFFTRHLLELCIESPDEMAFVMAHEMGHVVHKHAVNRMMANAAIATALQRLPLGGGLLRAPLGGLVSSLLRQGYSQDQELEADSFAIRLAASAGFDRAAGGRALGRLAQSSSSDSLSSYFGTHPPLPVRLANLRRFGGTG